ncbi:MAG: acyloxyacyl hydrolase [Myxococcaceae bacterium]
MLTLRALVAGALLLGALPAWCSDEGALQSFEAPWWGPHSAVLYTGFYGLRGPEEWGDAFFGLELRGGHLWWELRLMAGALSASDGSAYFYLGVLADLPIAKVLHVILSFAPGGYSPGTDHQLGYPLIFRSAAELSFDITPSFRLGVGASHMSNGKLAHQNTGVETLSLTLTFLALPY